ncbi:hypothetical protein ACFVXG_25790 [Kitasatospora sp. NPDC058162]|uniref:hypothetical protein n=1 Tax=Kitasatospora sp. NPDC058162 TaxID=3346362 RepID=UPI0036DB47FA
MNSIKRAIAISALVGTALLTVPGIASADAVTRPSTPTSSSGTTTGIQPDLDKAFIA